MADEYIDSVVSLVHFDGVVDGAISCIDAATGAIWTAKGVNAAISSAISSEINPEVVANWWNAAPNLTPVAAWDAGRVDGAQLLDGVGVNHITATSALSVGNFPLLGVAGNGNPMALTTPIPMPSVGVVAGFWSPNRNTHAVVLLSHELGSSNGYVLHISTDRRWYSYTPSGYGVYGLYGDIGTRYFAAIVTRGSDSVLYVNGDLVGDPVSSSHIMSQIAQVGYGGNGGLHNFDADEYLHALGVWSGVATQDDVKALEVAARAALKKSSLANSRFGDAAFYKPVAGHNYLYAPDSADLNMEGYDFTVEAWVYPLELRDGSFIFAKQTDTNRAGFAVGFMANGSLFATCSSSGSSFAGNAEDIAVGAWQHIALARMSGVVRLFVNGVLKHVWSDSTYMKNTAPATLGVMSASFSSQAEFIGYIDEFRISKGQCRYYKDFLPPDQPFTNPAAYPVKPPLSARIAEMTTGRLSAPVPEYYYNDKTGRSVEKPVGFLRHGVPQYLNLNTKVPYNNVAYFRFPIAQLLSHLPAPIRDTGLTLGRRDTVYGGAASLKGTLQVRGAPPTPISRTLRLMADDSRTIIYETKSDAATGAYEFPNLSTKFTYTIIALDYMGVYRALIATGQKATYD